MHICGIMTDPMAAASDVAVPDISEKNCDIRIFTCASPPRMWPTSDEQDDEKDQDDPAGIEAFRTTSAHGFGTVMTDLSRYGVF